MHHECHTLESKSSDLEEDEKSFLNVSILESSYCTDEFIEKKVPYRLAIVLCLVGHEFEECENYIVTRHLLTVRSAYTTTIEAQESQEKGPFYQSLSSQENESISEFCEDYIRTPTKLL